MADKDEHPVRTGLIVAAGTLAIGYGTTFIPGFFKGIWGGWKWTWSFLLATSKTPHWLLLILTLSILPSIWRFVRSLSTRRAGEKEPEPPTWRDYTEDNFFGAVWRWDYDYSGQMSKPWCFCPRCDTQLVYSEIFRGVGVRFRCEHCNTVPCQDEGGADDVVAKVVRQIDRKIRNGEWEQVVAARAAARKQLPPE